VVLLVGTTHARANQRLRTRSPTSAVHRSAHTRSPGTSQRRGSRLRHGDPPDAPRGAEPSAVTYPGVQACVKAAGRRQPGTCGRTPGVETSRSGAAVLQSAARNRCVTATDHEITRVGGAGIVVIAVYGLMSAARHRITGIRGARSAIAATRSEVMANSVRARLHGAGVSVIAVDHGPAEAGSIETAVAGRAEVPVLARRTVRRVAAFAQRRAHIIRAHVAVIAL